MREGEVLYQHGAFIVLQDREGRHHAVRRAHILAFSETEEGDLVVHTTRGSMGVASTMEKALALLA